MTSGGLIERLRTGLWKDNPGLVQLLGLCPLLAVTTTTINGVGLGIATLLVLTCSNALVSARPDAGSARKYASRFMS